MTVRYNISPELNMVIYICSGEVTGSEILKTADIAYLDKRRRHGMITVTDLFDAEVDFELDDLKSFLHWTEAMKGRGFEPEQIVMLTQNKGLILTCNALNLLSVDIVLKLSAFYSLDEAIAALNLLDSQDEIIQFWKESKLSKESN